MFNIFYFQTCNKHHKNSHCNGILELLFTSVHRYRNSKNNEKSPHKKTGKLYLLESGIKDELGAEV